MNLKLWRRKQLEYGGEKFSVELRPLKTGVLVALADTISLIDKSAHAGSIDVKEMLSNMPIIKEHIGEFARNLEGIQVDDEPITVEDLCDESAFAIIVMNICSEALVISKVGKDDEGNSAGQSPESKAEEATEAKV